MITSKSKTWYLIKSLIPQPLYEPLLNTYHTMRKRQYRGSSVFCPVCDQGFRAFIPGGNVGICPACSSGSRHRAIYLFLRKRTTFFTQRVKVLHFAPEFCFYRKFKGMANLDYLTADLNSPRAMVKIDMTRMPFADNQFDVVISSHVLEHIPDDLQAMRELCRVANNRGWSIHLAPIDYNRKTTFENPSINTPKERQEAYGHHDHRRIYGEDYADRLRSAGFTVEIFKPDQYLTAREISKFGIVPNEKIYCCTKKQVNR